MTAPHELDLVADLATERRPTLFGHCIYCGDHCVGLACGSHRDLLLLDPNTYELRLRESSPNNERTI